MPGYTVIDFETTGLFPAKHDRVVEIGVVYVDRRGEIEGEWTSLINPGRDVGPTHIHGITAREVMQAPTFAELAPYVLRAVAGRTVVAHNASFDLRFLAAELARAGLELSQLPLTGLCTMKWSSRYLPTSSRKLGDCCDAAGFDLPDAHAALADARAAARLLGEYLHATDPPPPWSGEIERWEGYPWPVWPRELPAVSMVQRGAETQRRPDGWLDRIVAGMPRQADVRVDAYLEILESALLDRYLAAYEEDGLVQTACELGLAREALNEIHREYLRSMARLALADGVLTERERDDLDSVAVLLGLASADVDAALSLAPVRPVTAEFALVPGDAVCLTGEMDRPRSEWEAAAATKGLSIGSITKRTKLLVAADPDSASRKAVKARKYGIPIITERAFAGLLGAMS